VLLLYISKILTHHVHPCSPEAEGVSIEDVDAFRRDHTSSKAAKAQGPNLFARQTWEDMDRDMSLDHDSENRNPSSNKKISPYLAKVMSPSAVTIPEPKPLPSSDGKFKERCSNGAVQAVLNEQVEIFATMEVDKQTSMGLSPTKRQCEVKVLGNPVAVNERFMVDRIADKASYVDHRIVGFEKEVEAASSDGAAHPVAAAAQKPTYFVGRVCCDTDDGRLNAQSVMLEGSVALSNGVRVRMDLSAAKGYRLFPGQIVVAKGTNPSGFCIAATAIETPPPLAQGTATAGAAPDGLSCIVAAGPYTTCDDLCYDPLAALLEYAAEAKPDVLLLAGPFVDDEHPHIAGGVLKQTFDDIFATQVIAQLEAFSERVDGATQVLLIPSPRDVHHDLVFPQGPLTQANITQANVIKNLANPATFAINDVVVGCSSVDWMMAITKEEISRNSVPADRMSALASHILNQRSYFPLFPPPLGVPLDTSHGYALELPCSPNLLIVPSDLAPFAKVVPLERNCLGTASSESAQEVMPNAIESAEETGAAVCINPGRLTKGSNAGTFAHVHIAPKVAQAEAKPVPLHDRCRVEIRKL
jgi:DNA polymerase alpha subunit B